MFISHKINIIMATFDIPVTCDNTTGSTNFKVKYRLMGDSIWTSYLIAPSSGTTITIPEDSPVTVLLNNRIYDFQIQNLNGADNPLSTIAQSIGFYGLEVILSPTSTTIGYSFSNLSVDIDSYTVQLATAAAPTTIVGTTVLTPTSFPQTLSSTFTGLLTTTNYILTVTPVANQFSQPFVFTFTTTGTGGCSPATNVIATLTTI
jgi:hypothetical protein